MSYDRKGQRYCDGCGRSIVKAHRRHNGDDYCASCYSRVFLRRPCRVCGELARFHQNTPYVDRVCGKCERVNRKCLRCGKPLPRAAKLVAGGAVCGSCAIYFAEKKPCERCGRLSARLSRVPALGVDELLCDHCRNQLTHKTCSVCHRYRVLAGTSPNGKPYCAACAPGVASSHACPTCGTTVAGAGHGRCLACLNRGRVDHEARLQELALSQSWARELYTGFGEWLAATYPANRGLLSVLARHFAFFQTLDSRCNGLEEVKSDMLLDCFGVAGLRTHTIPVRYLATRFGVEVDGAKKFDHVERQRIRAIVAENREQPWGSLIERYDRWLAAKDVAVRTRRGYLSAAARFCRVESVNETALYTSDQIRGFLTRRPGLRANLFKWNAFGKETLGCDVSMPPARRHARRPRTVRDLSKLLSKIEATGFEQAPVRLLERVIAKAFGYSVARFLGCEWSVENRAEGVWLCGDGDRLRVPRALIPVVVSWARRAGGGVAQLVSG